MSDPCLCHLCVLEMQLKLMQNREIVTHTHTTQHTHDTTKHALCVRITHTHPVLPKMTCQRLTTCSENHEGIPWNACQRDLQPIPPLQHRVFVWAKGSRCMEPFGALWLDYLLPLPRTVGPALWPAIFEFSLCWHSLGTFGLWNPSGQSAIPMETEVTINGLIQQYANWNFDMQCLSPFSSGVQTSPVEPGLVACKNASTSTATSAGSLRTPMSWTQKT